MEFLVAFYEGAYFSCEHEAGVDIWNPQGREFLVGEELFEEGFAVFGVYVGADDVGVEVNYAFFEEGVKVGLYGGAGDVTQLVVADQEETVGDFQLAGLCFQSGNSFVSDDGAGVFYAHSSPAAGCIHVFEGGSACLDVHVFSVVGLYGGISAAALDE